MTPNHTLLSLDKNKDTKRMHSSRMCTARSLPYGGSLSGGSLSKGRGVSIQEGVSVCVQGGGGSLSRGSLSRRDLCLGVSVQEGGGLCPGGSLSMGVSVRCENITLPQTSFAGGKDIINWPNAITI